MDSSAIPDRDQIVAFMDIGTNSVRLLLVRFNTNHSFTVLTDQKETVRLGEGEFHHNQLQPDAMRRAALVCGKLAEMARTRGAQQIVAVATSATREAENQSAFLRYLQRAAQLDVRVISGKEEARLIYLGVASGVNLGMRQALFVDVGGGSTEVIVGDQQQYYFLDSLKLGAIRLSSMFFRSDDTGPVSPSRYARMQRYVRTRSVRTLERLKQCRFETAIGSSGTIMNLAEIGMRLTHKRSLKKDDIFTRDQLSEVVRLLCSLPLEERRKVPGINPDRADIIVGGAAILETLLQELNVPGIAVSERGLREGLPVDYLSRSEHAHMFDRVSFRERSVLELGQRCGFDETHARHVTRLAWELFDASRAAGLHLMGDWQRELLEYAALLHDIGSFLSYNNHRAHSYYFIRNADLLGFDQTEIAIVANVALFHHKSFPRPKHPQFAELDQRSRKIVRVLCVLLRIAESLDRGHAGAVSHVHLRPAGRKSMVLEISPVKDCHLELWEVRNHEKAFERVFGRPLTIKVQAAAPADASPVSQEPPAPGA